MEKKESEGDVVANRANLLLAKSQRLLASWSSLKSELKDENGGSKDSEDDEFKDKTLGHELLGVGGKIPKEIHDGSFTRQSITSDDKLLENLIGKKAAKAHAAKQASKANTKEHKVAKRSRTTKLEESEDEEEGRASAFKSKRQKTTKSKVPADDGEDLEIQQGLPDTDFPARPAENKRQLEEYSKTAKQDDGEAQDDEPKLRKLKPKSGSYLDEILAERSKKKKKKKRN